MKRTHPNKVVGFTRRATVNDIKAVLIIREGFAYDVAMKVTKLSRGQVAYRCKMMNVRGADYRQARTRQSKIKLIELAKEAVNIPRSQYREISRL